LLSILPFSCSVWFGKWISYVENASAELPFSANDVYSEVDAVMQVFVDNNKDGLFKKDDNELSF
jgi:hypothetical protein